MFWRNLLAGHVLHRYEQNKANKQTTNFIWLSRFPASRLFTLSGVWCSIRQTGALSGEVHTRIHPSMYPQLSTADHNNRSSLCPGLAWYTVITVELWLSTNTLPFLRQTNDRTDVLSVCEKLTAGAPRAGEPTYCPHLRPSTVFNGDGISVKTQVPHLVDLKLYVLSVMI